MCSGDCEADADADGICDDVDDCVGALDACSICNGPGEIYECGCSDIPEGAATVTATARRLGVCGGDCAADAEATAYATMLKWRMYRRRGFITTTILQPKTMVLATSVLRR